MKMGLRVGVRCLSLPRLPVLHAYLPTSITAFGFVTLCPLSTPYTSHSTVYNIFQGIVNNGYYGTGSFEIRMGNENGGTALGGGVLTASNAQAWDQTKLPAPLNKWNHVIMTYDGSKLDIYLNKVAIKDSSTRDKGRMLTKNTPLVIGQAGPGTSGEFFYGYIKEVKIWGRALSPTDVAKEFQITR